MSFQKTVGYAATTEIKTGYSIKMLGEDMLFSITACNEECVYSEGKTIHICCRSCDDQDRIRYLFEKWWRGQAKTILEERVRIWFPIVEKYGVE